MPQHEVEPRGITDIPANILAKAVVKALKQIDGLNVSVDGHLIAIDIRWKEEKD